jgi:ATP-dependent Lhr-like helicase
MEVETNRKMGGPSDGIRNDGQSPISIWFNQHFAQPTPAQASAWPLIEAGHSVLIVSPTGTGKTFAAFYHILHQLARQHESGSLVEGIQCLYLSPLRALSYDLEKNLQRPLLEAYGPSPPIQVGLRSGDTEVAERQRQWSHPPHILLTTPESLTLLLSQARWVSALTSIRWVIIDEVHALAENKRGALLSLALERLDSLPGRQRGPCQRLGLSATVHPAVSVAEFLVGTGQPCKIVEASTSKKIDIQLYTPLQRHPYPLAGFSGVRMIQELGRLIRRHRTTLVFTNTRSGAESATFWLKENLPDIAERIECHHASLDRDVRLDVEDRLKRGELLCVVCSTSLELGLDIGSIDLVVMLSTPKGVSKALQRTGRAGHSLHEVSRGLLMATNVNDLIECAATARLARQGQLDTIRIAPASLDVLAQHLVGMGCHGEVRIAEALELTRRAYPYRDLTDADFHAVLDYLAGGGKSLRQQYQDVFGKIVLDEERGVFETRAGATRRDFLQNIGTIPNDGMVRILLRNSPLGMVEESFLRQLRPGDIFSLAGRALRLDRVGMMEAWVERADGATPTVPRWGANKMALSNRVGREIILFRSELRKRMEAIPFRQSPSLIPWIARRLECAENNAAIIFRVHATQHQLSELPTDDFLLVEELLADAISEPADPGPAQSRARRMTPARTAPEPQMALELLLADPRIQSGSEVASRQRPPTSDRGPGKRPAPPSPEKGAGGRHYFFHSLIGRAANDALSRVVALRLSRLRGGNAVATPDDYGFVLTVAAHQHIEEVDLPGLLTSVGFEEELQESLNRSNLLKYYFRSAAQTGLMVYRNYFGEQKSVRKLQWSSEVIFNVLSEHEPDHVLLREARRDTLHTHLDAAGAERFLVERQERNKPVRLRKLSQVSPLSFGMYATQIKEALLVEDPRETMERLYHHWWSQLGGSENEAAVPES